MSKDEELEQKFRLMKESINENSYHLAFNHEKMAQIAQNVVVLKSTHDKKCDVSFKHPKPVQYLSIEE